MFESNAGKARYTLQPIVIEAAEGQRVACCAITIFNSKDIGSILVNARYNAETKAFQMQLVEQHVDSATPTTAAGQANTNSMDRLTDLINAIPR